MIGTSNRSSWVLVATVPVVDTMAALATAARRYNGTTTD
jgi:hypothetical protein